MNILVAKNVNGVFQKVGVFVPNEVFIADPAGDFLSTIGYQYFKNEPAAVSFDIEYLGSQYRVNKF